MKQHSRRAAQNMKQWMHIQVPCAQRELCNSGFRIKPPETSLFGNLIKRS